MRFWTAIPLFFLLNYNFCGQEQPPQPNTLEISAETAAGEAIESVFIRVDHKGGAESAEVPAIFEIPADTDVLIGASRRFWSFIPSEMMLSLSAEELHELVFTGPAPATLTILCNEVGSGESVSGSVFNVSGANEEQDFAGPAADVELPIGLPFTITCAKLGWTFSPADTVLTLDDDFTLQIWGTPPQNPPATLNVSAQDGDGAAINGATILLNGEDSGFETPSALILISGFEYTLALELAGWDFAPADTAITLDAYAEDDLVFVGTEQVTLQHMVLLEDFSNVGCAGCPDAEQRMIDAMDAVGGQLISLSFHWNSPDAFGDPFFLYDNFPPPWQGPNYDRCLFLGIGSSLPQVVVDGEIMPATSQSVIADAIVAAQAREPVANMFLQREMNGADVLVTVTGELLSDPGAGPWRLYIILYEKHIVIDPAPGSNGQTEFHHIVRHGNYGGGEMGVDLESVLDGTSLEYSVKFNPNYDEVDVDGLRAVAFIQHSDSKVILDTVAEETGGH